MLAKLRTRVNQEKAWLVEQGDEVGRLAAQGNSDWASQGRLMLEAARGETCLLALLNLLRYQAARNKSWGGCLDLLSKALEECRNRSKGDEALAMELARHLLLYSVRAHKYHEESRRSPRAPPTSQGSRPGVQTQHPGGRP